MQYINKDGLLVFEYEDYQPTLLLGTQKARWFLINSFNWNSITFDDGLLSNTYNVDGTSVKESNNFRIEAKNYINMNVEINTKDVSKDDVPTWVYRIEGSFSTNKNNLFIVNNVFTFNNVSIIKGNIESIYLEKDSYMVLNKPIMNITSTDIINEIRD